MRSFRQILWRHVYRFGIPQLVLIAVGMLFVEWHYDHEFPSEQKILRYCAFWLAGIGILTLWNAWDEWRHASRASVE